MPPVIYSCAQNWKGVAIASSVFKPCASGESGYSVCFRESRLLMIIIQYAIFTALRLVLYGTTNYKYSVWIQLTVLLMLATGEQEYISVNKSLPHLYEGIKSIQRWFVWDKDNFVVIIQIKPT